MWSYLNPCVALGNYSTDSNTRMSVHLAQACAHMAQPRWWADLRDSGQQVYPWGKSHNVYASDVMQRLPYSSLTLPTPCR